MNKREICERLMEIRDQFSAGHLGPVGIGDALRDLILDISTEMKEEDEKLLPIYKAWQKLDALPSGTYMGTYDEVASKVMHEVHKAMRQIKEEQNNAPCSAD